jgi:hypothetical protein
LARAKNTGRAEARRRHREETRGATVQDDESDDALEPNLAPPAAGGLRGMFQMPNVREDIRILPGMLAHSPKLWIPFVMLIVAFVLAVLLTQGTTAPDGTFTSVLPSGVESIASLYVQLTLPPTALFVFFIGGFLAPRASYLVGAILGLVDGILWSLLFLLSPGAQPDAPGRLVQPTDVVAIILVAVVVGILAAGFASWYRNFLRSSQERARQNRAAREQQQRLKAKEDARAAKSAARQPSKVTGGTTATTVTPNTLRGTKPPKG